MGEHSSMDAINNLKNMSQKQMYIYGTITIINIFLTILSVSLHITNNYTHDHIVMYVFALIMTIINWYYHFNVYRKISPITTSGDPGEIKKILSHLGCIGFYDSLLNFVWFVIAVIVESILLADSVGNEEQIFLIIELILIIFVSFYNLITICTICNKSYDNIKRIDTEIFNVLGGNV